MRFVGISFYLFLCFFSYSFAEETKELSEEDLAKVSEEIGHVIETQVNEIVQELKTSEEKTQSIQ